MSNAHSDNRSPANIVSTLLDNAFQIFSTRAFYRAALARTLFKQSQLRAAQGRYDDSEDLKRKAFAYRGDLLPNDIKRIEELNDPDYDSMLIFWSR